MKEQGLAVIRIKDIDGVDHTVVRSGTKVRRQMLGVVFTTPTGKVITASSDADVEYGMDY